MGMALMLLVSYSAYVEPEHVVGTRSHVRHCGWKFGGRSLQGKNCCRAVHGLRRCAVSREWIMNRDLTTSPMRSGKAAYSTIVSAVNWVATNHKKPAVASMSIGGSYSQALNEAVTSLMGQSRARSWPLPAERGVYAHGVGTLNSGSKYLSLIK